MDRRHLSLFLAGGLASTAVAATGHLDPRILRADGLAIPHWRETPLMPTDTVLPGNAAFKLLFASSAVALFGLTLSLSHTLEQTETRHHADEDLAAELTRRHHLLEAETQLQSAAIAAEKRLQAQTVIEEAIAEHQATQRYSQLTGIPLEVMAPTEDNHKPQPADQSAIAPHLEDPSPPIPTSAPHTATSGLEQQQAHLLAALHRLGFPCQPVRYYQGAAIIQYLVKLVDSKQVKALLNSYDALQLEMSLEQPPILSIEAGAIAITLPRKDRQILRFADYIQPEARCDQPRLVIGVDVKGQLHEYVLDARNVESAVIGGIPGSGKSSMIQAALGSLACRYSPTQVQLCIFDGKNGVELSWLNGSPYLVKPVATTPEAASALLLWLRQEIEHRYTRFRGNSVSNLEDYNALPNVEPLPYIVAIADEFQDLFDLSSPKRKDPDGEPTDLDHLCSNASLGRAAGMPLVLMTQRPDRKVIPGQIDGKCATRIAFLLQRDTDSELLLSGVAGAERLLNKGDMLYKPGGKSVIRLQGLLASREDIQRYLFPSP